MQGSSRCANRSKCEGNFREPFWTVLTKKMRSNSYIDENFIKIVTLGKPYFIMNASSRATKMERELFSKEYEIRYKILPYMNELLEEVGDAGVSLWAHCCKSDKFTIVLEVSQEFKTIDRMKTWGLDFSHAEITMKCLGKFHAMSAVLSERGILKEEDFSENIFHPQRQMLETYCKVAVDILRKTIIKVWPKEALIYLKQLKEYDGLFMEMYMSIQRFDTRFNVLNIGDCCISNMLFKYGGTTNEVPVALRFQHFQMCFWTTYGLDLQYFLITSVKDEVRERELDKLLKAYHDSLHQHLALFNCTIENPPGLEEIRKELDRLHHFTIFICCTILPYLKRGFKDVPRLEDYMEQWRNSSAIKIPEEIFTGDSYIQSLKSVLDHNIKNG